MNKPNQVEIEENFMSNPISRTVVNYHWLLGFFALWLAFQILLSYFFNSSLNLRGTTTLVFTAMALCCALFFGLTARGIGHRQTSAVRWAKYFHMLIMIVGILGGCISFIGIFSLIFLEPAPSLADHIGRLLAVFFLWTCLYRWFVFLALLASVKSATIVRHHSARQTIQILMKSETQYGCTIPS